MAQTLLTRNIGPDHIHKGLMGSNRVFYFYFSFIFAFSLPIRVQKSLCAAFYLALILLKY